MQNSFHGEKNKNNFRFDLKNAKKLELELEHVT